MSTTRTLSKAPRMACPVSDLRSTKAKRGAVVIEGIRGSHQLERFSCGPAAVATVCRAYEGDPLGYGSWATIVENTGTKKGGGTSYDGIEAALTSLGIGHSTSCGEFGFETVYPALCAGDLIITTVQMPRHAGTDRTHWAVVAGASPSGVLVLNCTGLPLFTKRWMSWEGVADLHDDGEEMIRCETGLADRVVDRT